MMIGVVGFRKKSNINWGGLMANRVFTADDFFEIEDVGRVIAAQRRCADLLRDFMGVDVHLIGVNTNMGTLTVPLVGFISAIEANFRALTQRNQPAAMQPCVTWLGERRDARFFDYTDVNRWFETCELIEDMILGRGQNLRVAGTYCAGSNHTAQMVRRAG